MAAKKTTKKVAEKYEEMMEVQLEVAPFANVNYGKTDWITLEKKKKRINRKVFTSNILISLSIGLFLFSALIFWFQCRGIA